MRWGRDGRLVGRSARLVLGAALSFVAGCKQKFTGPYPCETGYASCVNALENSCETNVLADGLNCGSCGKVCAVGATCSDAGCGTGAEQFASLSAGMQPTLRTNSSRLFWSASNVVYSQALSAPSGTTPTMVATDGITCGNGGVPFAVDDANLYFFSSGSGSCSGGASCNGLTQMSLADGTRTVLVSDMGFGSIANLNVCGPVAANATSVFALISLQSGNTVNYTLASARIGFAGQVAQTLAMGTSNNGSSGSQLALSPSAAIFATMSQNGSVLFQVVPFDGSATTTLAADVNSYGNNVPFVADASNIYAIGAGCPCNDNNSNSSYSGPPQGSVTKIPLDGSASTILATFPGVAGGVAADVMGIYWSTDTSAWKVPMGGGAVTMLAGNLTNGTAAYQCNGCGGGGFPLATVIALGPSALYVGVEAATEAAILKVAR